MKSDYRRLARVRRHRRVRKSVLGTADRPRLCIFRSLRAVYAQVVDDERGATLVQANSLEPALRQDGKASGNANAARAVGKTIAERAAAAGISRVVFDRGGYIYHGRVKALADGAREGGLEF